jgi:very-short-patch-repair endonuclease
MNERQRDYPSANRQAKRLRAAMTFPERSAWAVLRAMEGLPGPFRRQCPIGPYIGDFVCFAERLVVEIDGPVHAFPGRAERDARRQAWLVAGGFRVLRVSSEQTRDPDGLEALVRQALLP